MWPALLEVDDEVARAVERLDLLDHREVERLLGGADVLAELLVACSSPMRCSTSWSPPIPIARWIRQIGRMNVVLAERAVPRDRVLVVRVDERAVDVEDGGARHAAPPTRS